MQYMHQHTLTKISNRLYGDIEITGCSDDFLSLNFLGLDVLFFQTN